MESQENVSYADKRGVTLHPPHSESDSVLGSVVFGLSDSAIQTLTGQTPLVVLVSYPQQ
jgi:hypothetical protein